MEGLYVRSRQENDKAFRSWLREKRRQAEYEREEQWHQVINALWEQLDIPVLLLYQRQQCSACNIIRIIQVFLQL